MGLCCAYPINRYATGGFFSIHIMMQNNRKNMKPWHTGIHLKVLIESYPMNTNMTGLRWFSNIFASLWMGESIFSIGRVKGIALRMRGILNHYAAAGYIAQYKVTQKMKRWLKPWHMSTNLTVPSESYPINTNIRGSRCFSKLFASVCVGRKYM